MKKKIISIALVGALVVSMGALAGCSSSSDSGSDESASEEQEEAVEEEIKEEGTEEENTAVAEGEEASGEVAEEIAEDEEKETSGDFEVVSEGETYSWQIGNVLANDQPWDIGLTKFAELLEEYSGGRITAVVQSNGVIGSEIEMLEAVQMGTLEISIASTPSYSGFCDAMNYFDLPYLFTDTETAWAVLDDWLGEECGNNLEGTGFHLLGYYDNGEYMIGSNVELLHPEQCEGVRIRAHSSQLQCDTLAACGADPLNVAWGDIYTSLQQGTIDAVSGTTLTNMYGGNFYEQCKYIYMTKQHFIPAPVSINEDLWNSLSDADQELVQRAFDDSRVYQFEQASEFLENAIQVMEDSGCEIYDVDTQEWADATASVYDDWVGTNGLEQDVIDQIKESAEKLAK